MTVSLTNKVSYSCRQAVVLVLCALLPGLGTGGVRRVAARDVDRWPVLQFVAPPPIVFVLSIGIDRYSDEARRAGVDNLEGAARDATLVPQAFEGNALTGHSVQFKKTVLLNADATKENIRRAIQGFTQMSTASDLFVLSFSGHAFSKTKDGVPESYLVPADVHFGTKCTDGVCLDESTLISGALLNSWMAQMHAQRQIILLDSSFTDQLLPAFEQHWRKESCSVGPVASKRLLIATNHDDGFEIVRTKQPVGALTSDFVDQMQHLRGNGLLSSFGLQQAMYRLSGPDTPAAVPGADPRPPTHYRVEMLGGDFVIDGPAEGVKRTDLLLDSDLGAICGSDAMDASRGLKAGKDPKDDGTAAAAKQTNYALVIASDQYRNWPKLENPIFDATTIEHDLSSIYGFKTEHLWNPSRTQLRQKLNDLHTKNFNDNDQLFVFIAGHGDYDEASDIGYLVFPETGAGHDYDAELSLLDLRKIVDKIPAKHIFLVMDSCFAGSLDPALGGTTRGPYDALPLAKLMERASGKTTKYFLTSGGKEYVSDGFKGLHSPFAALFIAALERKGQPDGYLNLSQMPHYFERLPTRPRAGNLGDNEDGADFFFIPAAPAEALNEPRP